MNVTRQAYPPPAGGARMHTEELTVSMGPQHPSTHGVLRLEVVTDGEVVVRATPDIGYLHRGLEKIAEALEYRQFMPYTDRLDYVCAMNSNHAYALAVEKLAGIPVPRRAELLRVMAAELNRISSHMIALGSLSMDMGAFTPFLYGIAHREKVNDIFEALCGARLTHNYLTIGGVSRDAYPELRPQVENFVESLGPEMVKFNELITGNSIFEQRLCNVGVISGERAVSYGLAGPNLRASGIQWDLRKDEPYSLYGQLDFDAPVGDGGWQHGANPRGALGDCYDRFVVRVKEVSESLKILRQVVARLKENDQLPADHADRQIQTKLPARLRVRAGEVYVRSENPRGETGYYLVSEGGEKPARCKIRTGSFTALAAFEELTRGLLVSDLMAVIGSLDIILPEVDR
jgi:NADH-quinone oxidoreductase subunit D